jgi:predicted RNA binding protein YcfA (HicA-like mRNA interferase family)
VPIYPKLTAKEAEMLLFQAGFVLDRQKGSHRIYKRLSQRMVIPHHAGEVLHPKIVKELFELIDIK